MQIIDTWGKKALNFDPGTQWQYSNTNYTIAGGIAEKVAVNRKRKSNAIYPGTWKS